jgi:hypothetical protein
MRSIMTRARSSMTRVRSIMYSMQHD